MSKWIRPHNPANDAVTGRVIYKMTKKRSKSYLVFTEDPEDPWFIWEYTVEISTNKVKERCVLVAKDLPQVIRFRENWSIERVNIPIEEAAII